MLNIVLCQVKRYDTWRVKIKIHRIKINTLLFLISFQAAHAGIVETIDISGAKTPPDVILNFFDTKTGDEFDADVWKQDVQRLRNTELFFDIDSSQQEESGRIHLDVHAHNKHSLIPIIKYKQGGGTSLYAIGAYEVNLLNRLLEAGGQYENVNGLDGGVVWFRHPYFLSHKNHFGAELYVQSLDLPLLTLQGEEQAHFNNAQKRFNSRILHVWRPGLRIGLGMSVYHNKFLVDSSNAEYVQRNATFLANKSLQSGRTVSLLPRIVLGRINRNEFHIHGQEVSLHGEIAHNVLGSEFDFILAQAHWLGAWIPYANLNIAAQAQIGAKTGHEIQHKFYLGGLDTVRGFLDGQFRGDHFWVANLELRPTLWRSPLVVLQGNVFADLAKTWDEQQFSSAGFEDPFVSFGFGLRAILPRVYRATIRLDIARTQQPVKQTGVAFGLQQFF